MHEGKITQCSPLRSDTKTVICPSRLVKDFEDVTVRYLRSVGFTNLKPNESPAWGTIRRT